MTKTVYVLFTINAGVRTTISGTRIWEPHYNREQAEDAARVANADPERTGYTVVVPVEGDFYRYECQYRRRIEDLSMKYRDWQYTDMLDLDVAAALVQDYPDRFVTAISVNRTIECDFQHTGFAGLKGDPAGNKAYHVYVHGQWWVCRTVGDTVRAIDGTRHDTGVNGLAMLLTLSEP